MRWYTSVKNIGNKIYLRGYEDGLRFQDVYDYSPNLYIKSKEETNYKNLKGEYLSQINFPSIRNMFQFLEKYKDVDGFEIYGNESPIYQFIADQYPEENTEFEMKNIRTFYLDIETTSEYGGVDIESAREQILLITIMDYVSKKTITFGSRQFSERIPNNTFIECKNEAELLERFLKFWEKDYPDIVSGWNIEYFDIPYIIKRIEKTLGENQAKRLSPWKHIRLRTSKTDDSSFYEIFGVNVLDYLAFFKKYSGINVENNRLDTVAKEVLNESKLDHTEYETFADFYTNDWNLFVRYNIVDTELIGKLEEKLGLLKLAMALALSSKVNSEDTLSQGRMWDAIIYNYLFRKNIIIPIKRKNSDKTEKYKGAFVKPPQLGKFKWVASFDVSSLYPSIIRTYNISPETLVDERNYDVTIDGIVDGSFTIKPEYENYSICANGSMYNKEKQGFLPKIMEDMFNERSMYKKKMLEAKKQVEQIEMELARRNITY